MDLAITEALEGSRTGGIPIGAVLECDGRLYQGPQPACAGRESDPAWRDERAAGGWTPDGRRLSAQHDVHDAVSRARCARGPSLLYGIPRVVVGENVTFMGEEALLRSRA
jgi:cytosine deaminase